MKLVKFTRTLTSMEVIYINPEHVVSVYSLSMEPHTTAMGTEIEATCIELVGYQKEIVDAPLSDVVAALNAPARLEYKREFIEKTMTQEFWDGVIENDGPEGIAYARDVLGCIRSALSKYDALDRLLGKPPEKGHE